MNFKGRTYTADQIERWRNREAPPLLYHIEQERQRRATVIRDARDSALALTQHRRQQMMYMGTPRPEGVLDGILYDIDAEAARKRRARAAWHWCSY